jgi:hypothetical protein
MVLEGVFSSEVVDSSGEIVILDGMDITTLEAGEGVANYEHTGKEGGGKEIVGKIIYVKKITKLSDCEDSSQRYFFEQVRQRPYLYGQVRLFDGAGHAEAKDLAAQIRDYAAHDEPILVRFSIEGSTLTKEGNVIKECIARKVALTITPANKVCNTKLVQDPNAPEGFELKKAELLQDPMMHKLGGTIDLYYNPILTEVRLIKTVTAGGTDAAPSSLTQGSALQREDLTKTYSNTVLAAMRDYDGLWDKKRFKEHLKQTFQKALLPEASDEFIEHFANIADDWKVKGLKKSIVQDSPFNDLFKLENQAVEIKKAIRNIVENNSTVTLPKIYKIGVKRGDQVGAIGRVMVADDKLHHLEDYHNMLGTLLPEGPITEATSVLLGALLMHPNFSVQEHAMDSEPNGGEPQPEVNVAQEDPLPPRQPYFEYTRPGMAKPSMVEFGPNGAAIDGEALDPNELSLLLENASNGVGTIKWGIQPQDLNKREATEDLINSDDSLKHVRTGVESGAIHPSVEKALTRHVYEDPMLEGVGNKYAAQKFLSQNKPGVYASIEPNDLDAVKAGSDHQAFEGALKGMAGALKEASNTSGTTKVFQVNDRLAVWAPTHEDMSHFLRHATTHVEALPAIGGTHKQSFSVGIGHTFGMADEALGHAKAAKLDPVSGQSIYKPGTAPNLGYSLHPGHEGHLFGSTPKVANPAPAKP